MVRIFEVADLFKLFALQLHSINVKGIEHRTMTNQWPSAVSDFETTDVDHPIKSSSSCLGHREKHE